MDGADKYGLSQLHQLRGRVGRGRERAYAYFLYPSEKPLGEVALERLKAVATHNELGAGMQLAMKDLEIRGAGNLLGGEQSGHIQGVGFDLYIRLVGEAVADYRGEAEEKAAEMKIELPVNAHLPHDYVPGERLRLEAYRKLAAAVTNEAIDEVLAELVDRYGEPPLPAQNLVAVARFRVGAREAGLSDVALQGNFIKFSPAQLPESKTMRLNRMYPGAQSKPALDAVLIPKPKTAKIGGRDLQDAEILEWANGVIRNIFSDAPYLSHRRGVSRMMGGHHAASGAAAWVAVASTGPYTLGWYPLDATGVLIGGMATAGTALVCDWDHRSAPSRTRCRRCPMRLRGGSRTPAAGTGRGRIRCWARRSSLCSLPWPARSSCRPTGGCSPWAPACCACS